MTEATPEQKKRPIRVLILWNHLEVAQVVNGSAADESDSAAADDSGSAVPDASDSAATDDSGSADTSDVQGEPVEPAPHRMAALADELEQILEEHGFDVSGFDLDDDPTRIHDAVTVARPALVFNLVEHFYGDTTLHAHMAASLDLLGVPYTGADALCLATGQDRVRTHLLLDDAGIPVPRFAVIRDVNVIPDTAEFRFPIIVTQAFDDLYEEEGIDRPIADHDELLARSAALFKEFDLPYLVEEYIGERRLHAIVMGNRALEVLPLVEYDGSDDADRPWALAQLDYETVDRVRQLARRAFRVMGCRDMAQIDFHLDHDSNPHVVDVRPMFDLGPGSVFRGAAEHTAGGYQSVLVELVKLTCKRAQIDATEEERPAPDEPPPADGDGEDEAAEGEAEDWDEEAEGEDWDEEAEGEDEDWDEEAEGEADQEPGQ